MCGELVQCQNDCEVGIGHYVLLYDCILLVAGRID